MADDNIQHGIDDDPRNDAEKGAALGGLGGAAVGAVAGSMTGPVGAVVGAVAGGLAGAGASGAAVSAVDKRDNDNNVTGVGDEVTFDKDRDVSDGSTAVITDYDGSARDLSAADANLGNDMPGIQTGGVTTAGPDTRGLTEKAADSLTGDRIDDNTGGVVLDTDAAKRADY